MQINNNFNNYDRTSFAATSDLKPVYQAANNMRTIYQNFKYPRNCTKNTLEPELLLDYLKTRFGEQFKWYILALPSKDVKKLLAAAQQNFRTNLQELRANLFKLGHCEQLTPAKKRALVKQSTQITHYIEQSQKK